MSRLARHIRTVLTTIRQTVNLLYDLAAEKLAADLDRAQIGVLPTDRQPNPADNPAGERRLLDAVAETDRRYCHWPHHDECPWHSVNPPPPPTNYQEHLAAVDAWWARQSRNPDGTCAHCRRGLNNGHTPTCPRNPGTYLRSADT